MSLTILSTTYGECWGCNSLDTLYELGQRNKNHNMGREYLCSNCFEKVSTKRGKDYWQYKRVIHQVKP